MKRFLKSGIVLFSVIFFMIMLFPVFLRTEGKEEKHVSGGGDCGDIVWAGAINTGASSASRTQKGGAIFLEPNTRYTLSGGTISGKRKTYGGAVFISSGATFTMTGGTIQNCSASYGGGIYVCAGATCNIEAGTITACSASIAGPAIYIEDGGTLNLGSGANVRENDIYDDTRVFEIAGNGLLGGTHNGIASTVSLDYGYLGTYPQMWVGEDMKYKLESWYVGQPVAKTYVDGKGTYNGYLYTDGEIYVRVENLNSHLYSTPYFYDGTRVGSVGTVYWFKVEPIKWFIINKNGNEYELFSEIALATNLVFDENDNNDWADSYIRSWSNNEFLNSAFTVAERRSIKLSTIGNNVTDDYDNALSDTRGISTQDYIYLKSYYELTCSPFDSYDYWDSARMCCASDFAISCGASFVNNSSSNNNTTFYRGNREGNTYYVLRSAAAKFYVWSVNMQGGLDGRFGADDTHTFRPALVLKVK